MQNSGSLHLQAPPPPPPRELVASRPQVEAVDPRMHSVIPGHMRWAEKRRLEEHLALGVPQASGQGLRGRREASPLFIFTRRFRAESPAGPRGGLPVSFLTSLYTF